jgi:transcriptional regulator with XRE-family HTH domain
MKDRRIVRLPVRREQEIEEMLDRIKQKMKPWGITVTYLAGQLGVSRQYVWQIMYYQTFVSKEKLLEIERAVDTTIRDLPHMRSFGDRMRVARISAGLTLKQVAQRIGYTWVAVERWEKNICLPKPGVLWHLRALYAVGENWLPHGHDINLPTQTPHQWTQAAGAAIGGETA